MSNCLFPIETHKTYDFPEGGSGPPVLPSGSALDILDLLVTIGYNIQSTVAYRSTGMELRCFFHSGST